jgi:hypothetical protein
MLDSNWAFKHQRKDFFSIYLASTCLMGCQSFIKNQLEHNLTLLFSYICQGDGQCILKIKANHYLTLAFLSYFTIYRLPKYDLKDFFTLKLSVNKLKSHFISRNKTNDLRSLYLPEILFSSLLISNCIFLKKLEDFLPLCLPFYLS